jgi:hypothetical protein
MLVQPLAKAAVNNRQPYAILLADRARSRLFLVSRGRAEEVVHQENDPKQVRHNKTAGIDHTNSSSRFQRKADNRIRENLRAIVRSMEALAKASPLKIILAGTSRITAELRGMLPARLAAAVIGEVVMPMAASPDRVVHLAEPIAQAKLKPVGGRRAGLLRRR